ncbi:MAG: hydrogenase 4 subunit B [Gammaproteobacteria bacterium]|nr:hydrogenase 4 subunit B [Gammaproteobacteria bacterium]
MALNIAYLAVIAALASAAVALGADFRRSGLARIAMFLLLGVSGVAATVAGGWALLENLKLTEQLALGLPWLHWHLRLDALSGFFFAVVGLLLVAVSLYGPAYVRELEGGKQPLAVLGLFTGLFAAGMLLVLLADDAFAFMVAWELMSVSSYFLVTHQHQNAPNRRAGFLYLLMAHVGALAILLGFGVLAGHGGNFTFDAMRAADLPPLWASIAFALAFFGFGMKAGLVPVHAWLPEAHPVAPSHISALMSGVMLKVAIYGFIRVSYDLIGDIQWQWGLAVLIVGTLSALLGVLYTLMQNDLKRLLAYSSVENIGIVFMGLGLSMIFLGTDHPVLGVIGLIAALYHVLNHAVFKGLLFLGAGAVQYRTHERDLERMGGLIHRMPATAALFLIGCVSIAALPPFNGFVSEWLTFQTALQTPKLESGVLRAILPIAAALLALTGALAAAAFVKVYGVAFLGKARERRAGHAREVPAGMLAGMGLLAVLCLVLGILPTTVIGVLENVPRLLLGQVPPSLTAHGWLWLTPVSAEVASYSAPLVLAAIAITFFVGRVLLRRKANPVRRGAPWDCGFGPLNARMQYTAAAFAQPIRRVFGPVWKVQEQVEVTHAEAPVTLVSGIRHQLHISDWSWFKLYEPIGRLVLAGARRIGRLHSGSIRTYLMYSFATLLLLLWIVT